MKLPSKQYDMPDWTTGTPALRYQSCGTCDSVWYFVRTFCPRCGTRPPVTHAATGRGVVYAATVVHRAPSQRLSAHVPYTLLLVDAAEGFRLMAHGSAGLAIGDPVQVAFRPFCDALVPHFTKDSRP